MNFIYLSIIFPLYLIIECIYSFALKVTDSPGISVICISIAVTLLCLPLYAVAEKWQQIERDTEKKLKPGIDRIKQTFKGDEQYMILTTFYRENHYHPLMALRSSFGLLIQIPFFIAAYSFLSKLSSLQGQCFLFIRDMGSQDALFHIGSFPVNVLPIAMTVINIVAGAIYTKGFPVKEKIQIYGMALVFLALLYTSPSGLVLYWTMNNVFSLVKNVFYKTKKPLKTFWIFCCIICFFLFVFFAFFASFKMLFKMVACVCIAFVFVMPFIVKLIKNIVNNRHAFIINDTKARNILFILCCVCMFLLSGTVIPSSLISSSPIEFSELGKHQNPISFVYTTLFESFGLWIFWPLCIYFLFNKKIQTFLTILMGSVSICAIVNTFAFSLSYGDISTSLIFLNGGNLNGSKMIMLLDFLMIAVVFVLCALFFSCNKGKVFTSLFTIGVISLFGISCFNFASIGKSYNAYQKQVAETGGLNTKPSPIFHFSKDKENVVLFMLDRAQSQYFSDIVACNPDIAAAFTGFTFYPNTVSFNGHTLMAAPALYAGYDYTPLEINKRDTVSLNDKNTESLLTLPRIFSEEKNFSVIVTDPSWANYNSFTDLSIFDNYNNIKAYKTIGRYTSSWYNEHSSTIDDSSVEQLKRNLFMFSFFRESPVFLREVIYRKGSYWSTQEALQDQATLINNYSVLDYLPDLTDFTSTNGTYTCVVNELTHEDFELQAPDYIPVNQVTVYGTSKYAHEKDYATEVAALKMLSKWISYLKENDVYNNTRIIIVGDHGDKGQEDYFEKDDTLDQELHGSQYWGRGHYHPLLLYKDFNAIEQVIEDTTFMTNADVPSLLLRGIVENPVNPFTKKTIPLDTTSLKKDGVIISVSDNHQPAYNGKNTFTIKQEEWWVVTDPIDKASSWKRLEQ